MENKTINLQPRFFCVKLLNISNININQFQSTLHNKVPGQKEQHNKNLTDKQAKSNKFQIIFEIGSKKSSSQFKYNENQKPIDFTESSIGKQMHIIPYEYEQVMSIKLILGGKKRIYGYSLMPLNPLIKMPHTCHQIDLNLVFQKDNKQIVNKISAVLQIQFYYLLNFKGILFIQPIQAHLTKNQAALGQMKPFIEIKVNNKVASTKTIEQGGIRPVWRQKMSKKHQLYMFAIQSAAIQFQLSVKHISLIRNSQIQVGKASVKVQQKQVFKYAQSISSLSRSFVKGLQYQKEKHKKGQKEKDSRKKENQNQKKQLDIISPTKQKLNQDQQQKQAFKISNQFQDQLKKILEQGKCQIQFQQTKQKQKKTKKEMQMLQKRQELKQFKSYFLSKMLIQKQVTISSYDKEQEQQQQTGRVKFNMGFIYTFQLDQNDSFQGQSG